MNEAVQIDADVAVLGQSFYDLVFQGAPLTFSPGTETYASGLVVSPGGAATRAIASARLGARTALVSELADDEFGRLLREALEAERGLSLEWCGKTNSTPVSVALTSAQDRAFLTFDRGSDAPSFAPTAVPTAQYLHVGLVEGITPELRAARSAGSRVVAGVGWDGTETWPKGHLDALEDVDIFCPNADEAMAYTRTTCLADALTALSQLVPTLIVTDGPRGAWFVSRDDGDPTHIAGIPTRAVDPTGAGDVFIASVMVELSQGRCLIEAVRFANAAAAIAVTTPGGAISAPTRLQVDELLSSRSDTYAPTHAEGAGE